MSREINNWVAEEPFQYITETDVTIAQSGWISSGEALFHSSGALGGRRGLYIRLQEPVTDVYVSTTTPGASAHLKGWNLSRTPAYLPFGDNISLYFKNSETSGTVAHIHEVV